MNNMLPGQQRGRALGYVDNHWYVQRACVGCGARRWARTDGNAQRCKLCSARLLRRKHDALFVQVLEVMVEFKALYDLYPFTSEICARVKRNRSTVQNALRELRATGKVKYVRKEGWVIQGEAITR